MRKHLLFAFVPVLGTMFIAVACSSGSGSATAGLEGGALVPGSDGGTPGEVDASTGDADAP